MSSSFFVSSLMMLMCVHAVSSFTLSSTLGSHMVLQRDTSSLVWGFDQPNAIITTIFQADADFNEKMGVYSPFEIDGDFSVTLVSKADATGVFRQRLPPTKAGGPYKLTFTSTSANNSIVFEDVLFGDVYFCGGQSNMQFSVAAALNGSNEIAAAHFPSIRVFSVGQGTQSQTPLTDLASVQEAWTAVTPASVGNGDFSYFSALCYFFVRDLQMSRNQVIPMGAISNNWGGTCLESWTPSSVSASCGISGSVPSLYNAMIVPYITGPMAVTGFLWSQGECNADENTTIYYACAFPKFIDDWRTSFHVPLAFFGFELLPAYISDGNFDPSTLPVERAAQLAAMKLKNVVVSNAIDLGDAQAPYGSVHPRDKQDVAKRFVPAALNVVYGEEVEYKNPTYLSSSAVTSGKKVRVTIFFDSDSVSGGGLTITPKACPVNLTVPLSECSWYEVQMNDNNWYNASSVTVTEDGQGLYLDVDTVPAANMLVMATRGNFSPWPVVIVYSKAGFPALPWFYPVDSAVIAPSSADDQVVVD